jgi:hypothetical protein
MYSRNVVNGPFFNLSENRHSVRKPTHLNLKPLELLRGVADRGHRLLQQRLA